MKRYLILLLSALLMLMGLHAQDVWREGTRWEVECLDEGMVLHFTFELRGHTVLDGVDYLNLNDVNQGRTIGYIRSERGDTLVYARLCEVDLSDEFLLYDFGTFEPDTYFHYSIRDSINDDPIPLFTTETDTITAEGLTYYHDVIAEGDILPCWNNVLFKVGCLDGPMAYVYDSTEDSDSIPTYACLSSTKCFLNNLFSSRFKTPRINKFRQFTCYNRIYLWSNFWISKFLFGLSFKLDILHLNCNNSN